MELTVVRDLAIALGLGFLVGLQREWATKELAGIRTFPLITLLGAMSALLADAVGEWVVGAAALALAAMIVMGNVVKLRAGQLDAGITTEVAALVMFAVGAALMLGHTAVAVVVGGLVAVLLHWKRPLHRLVGRFGRDDLQAVIRLALIGLVILPILPNRSYGPYGVLNPFQIWLMVVLIVGISLAAYVAYRLLGARRGTLAGGLLGGLISSTAATVGYARETRVVPSQAQAAGVMIVLASTIVFVRVLVEIAIVQPGMLSVTAPPLLIMMVFMAALAGGMFVRSQGQVGDARGEREPPSDLKAAIVFGVLYAVVLVAVAAAKEHFGAGGLFVVAGLSGLTDMDAITLSTAQLVRSDRLQAAIGWRIILVGAMANLVFKGIAVAALGHPRLALRIAAAFGAALLVGALLLAFWPA